MFIVNEVVANVVSHLNSQSQKDTPAKDKLGVRKSVYSIMTALCAVLREACVFER